MNDPQIAIQLHWIAEGIYKLAKVLDNGFLVVAVIGWLHIMFHD